MVLDIADASSDRLHKSSKETFPSWIIGYIELPLYLGRGETQNVHIHHKTLEHHQIIFYRKKQKLLLLNFFPVTREKKRLHIPDKSCIIQIIKTV